MSLKTSENYDIGFPFTEHDTHSSVENIEIESNGNGNGNDVSLDNQEVKVENKDKSTNDNIIVSCKLANNKDINLSIDCNRNKEDNKEKEKNIITNNDLKENCNKDDIKEEKQCKSDIFIMYVILAIVITLLIFLIIIRGFIIPVINKDWFFPIFILGISYAIMTILAVGYSNHVNIKNEGLKTFLIFFLIVHSIVLLITLSQFYTHGNVKDTSVLAALLTLSILIWFILSYKNRVSYLLLGYALLMALFTYLMMTTIKLVD